jgi:hypothetical protein
MMTLTTEQLAHLSEQVHSRLKEFDMPDALLPSRGVIRVVHEILVTWQDEQLAQPDSIEELAALWPAMPDLPDGVDHFAEHAVTGKPDPDVARGKLAHALANGSGGALAPVRQADPARTTRRPGVVLPTLDDLLRELKRQSMGGVAPSMAAFDIAKPANWATGQAHCKRLGMTWGALVEAAGLKPRRTET